MKHFKRFGLLVGLVLISFGCSGENEAENERTELIESFLQTSYAVQYEETLKLYDEFDRVFKGEIEEKDLPSNFPKAGEAYPKTFAPYFTERGFEVSAANGIFRFLPMIAVTKEADYELQSLKQLSSVEKDGYWDYAYEVALNETIGDQVTLYTDEVRFYVEEEKGEWKISNVRFYHQDYARVK